MSLQEYFENTSGTGVLATSDAEGRVDVAVYAKPHFIDGNLAFIMNDRLSHHNLQSNFNAAFLFKEDGGHRGKRLFLKKIREEQDTELLYSIRRREYPAGSEEEHPPKFLVFFEVTKELPLIGSGDK